MDVNREAKKRLVALIEQRDEPLAVLAVRVGVSQSTLWNFVYGETKNFSKLHRLAALLNISLDWVQHGDRAPDDAPPAPDRFAEPAGLPPAEEPLFRAIAVTVADLARAHTRLSPAILGGIAVAAWAEARDGRAGERAAKVAAIMKRLAAYEEGKRRRPGERNKR